MIDVRRLQRWRRPDLEAIVYRDQGQTEGDIAGDMILGSHSIRFSVQQFDESINAGFVSLSGPNQSRLSDVVVKRFLVHIGIKDATELRPGTPGTFVRSFKINHGSVN